MKFKKAKLKDDTEVTLRLMVKKDLDDLHKFYQKLPLEDRQFLRMDVTKKENVYLRFGKLDYDLIFPLLALRNEEIIGIATIFRAEFGWQRNLGEVRVVVAHDYQKKGLGTILTKELFFQAIKSNLYKLEAEIVGTQLSARSAFERFGFREECKLNKHVTDINGNRCDLIIMTLDIEELWYLTEDSNKDPYFNIC